jgi:hypothetical protein
MQPESMRTPLWRSRSFAFSGAEHVVCPYSRRLTRFFDHWVICSLQRWGSHSPVAGRGGRSAGQFSVCSGTCRGASPRRTAAGRGARRLAALRLRGARPRVPGGARGVRTEPVRRPGPGYARRRRVARAVSRLQRRPADLRGGPCGCVVQAVRPGDHRDHGRLAVATATRSLDDRTGPESHHPAHPDAGSGPAAQDPAHRDVAASGARGGDDRRAQLRAAVPRAGATPRATARPPARARTARSSGSVALHRDRGRLAGWIGSLRISAPPGGGADIRGPWRRRADHLSIHTRPARTTAAGRVDH